MKEIMFDLLSLIVGVNIKILGSKRVRLSSFEKGFHRLFPIFIGPLENANVKNFKLINLFDLPFFEKDHCRKISSPFASQFLYFKRFEKTRQSFNTTKHVQIELPISFKLIRILYYC